MLAHYNPFPGLSNLVLGSILVDEDIATSLYLVIQQLVDHDILFQKQTSFVLYYTNIIEPKGSLVNNIYRTLITY